MHSLRRFHDVASRGITGFRAALTEVYADELAEIERGSALPRVGLVAARRRAKALCLAWQKRKQGRTETTPEPTSAEDKKPTEPS